MNTQPNTESTDDLATLQARWRRWELALDMARELIWEVHVPTGRLTYSRYHSRLKGLSPGLPATLDEWLQSVHAADRAALLQAFEDHVEGRAEEFLVEFRQLHRDGHWVWSSSRGRVVEHDEQGRALCMVGINWGISRFKNLELELRDNNRQLAEREAELRAAVQRAEEIAATRTQFLATMSHEIRTPLNSIVAGSRLALRETDLAMIQDNLRMVHTAAQDLLALVNRVLDFSRLRAGGLQLEEAPVDLASVVQPLRDQFGPLLRPGVKLGVEVAPEVPQRVIVDGLRLRQVLANLLSNAVKFTDAGTVDLQLAVLARQGNTARVSFTVADTGPGLSEEQAVRLFSPYVQADTSIARRFGGTGLGLAISHQLVGMMGGELRVDSRTGAGSRFFFALDLPVADEASTPQALDALPLPATRLDGLQVMIVDDNAMNRVVLRRALQADGMQVIELASAPEAIALLANPERPPVSMVLMDLYMPELNGADATRRIRQLAGLEALPIVALSASVTPEERQLCLDAGMDEFLSKPVDLDELRSVLLRRARPAA